MRSARFTVAREGNASNLASRCTYLPSLASLHSWHCILSGWTPGTGENARLWTCVACRNQRWLDLRHTKRHEATRLHQRAMQYRIQEHQAESSSSAAQRVAGPLYELLHDVSHAASSTQREPLSVDNADALVLDWETISSQISGDLAPSTAQSAVVGLTTSLMDWLATDPDAQRDLSDSEPDERSNDSEPLLSEAPAQGMFPFMTANCVLTPHSIDDLLSGIPRTYGDYEPDPEWFPWPDKAVR